MGAWIELLSSPHSDCEVEFIFPFWRWKTEAQERLCNLPYASAGVGWGPELGFAPGLRELQTYALSALRGAYLSCPGPPAPCSLFPFVTPALPSSSSVSPQPLCPVREPAACLSRCQGSMVWAGPWWAVPRWELRLSQVLRELRDFRTFVDKELCTHTHICT